MTAPDAPGARRLLGPCGALLLALAAACGVARPSAPAALPPSRPQALPVSLSSFAAGFPRIGGIAADAAGGLHAVFVDDADHDRHGDRVLYTRRVGGTWMEPVRLDDASGVSAAPRVVAEPDGRAHAFWFEGLDPRLPTMTTVLLHRAWDGARWSPPETLYREPPGRGQVYPNLAVTLDGEGRVQVVHTRAAGGFVALTLAPGGAWSTQPTGTDGSSPRWDAAPRRGAGVGMVFVAARLSPLHRSANNDVWFQELRDGRWSEPAPVYVGTGWSYDPELLTDGRGVRHAVWLEGMQQGRTERVLHATSPDGERWSEPEDVTPAVPGGDFQSPRLSLTAAGRVELVVTRHEGTLGNPRHFRLRLEDGRWSAAEELFGELGPSGGEMLTASGPGALYGVWRGGDGVYRSATLGE
jgi:hypothetical protein